MFWAFMYLIALGGQRSVCDLGEQERIRDIWK
jgi:hypothetical protein